MLYLAAAVSDFYVRFHTVQACVVVQIPAAGMETHKIQSSGGPLHLVLQQTPKLLGLYIQYRLRLLQCRLAQNRMGPGWSVTWM